MNNFLTHKVTAVAWRPASHDKQTSKIFFSNYLKKQTRIVLFTSRLAVPIAIGKTAASTSYHGKKIQDQGNECLLLKWRRTYSGNDGGMIHTR